MKHLRAFQAIAEANGNTRASGTPGYAASRDYVAGLLKKAGYNVTVQPFAFPFFRENSTAAMSQVSPEAKTYTPTPPDGSSLGDFATMTYSGSGDVTGTVQAVDLTLPPAPEPGSTSGCDSPDFTGFTPGNIALVQRGTCDFEVKARNAQAAGVIIFNEGQPGRTATLQGTLNQPGVTIPTVGVSFAVGEDLASPAGTVVRLRNDTESETRTTWNVLAESKKGDPNKVVMGGAHLDGVLAGPGINDNGSGSAALLEVAVQMGKLTVRPPGASGVHGPLLRPGRRKQAARNDAVILAAGREVFLASTPRPSTWRRASPPPRRSSASGSGGPGSAARFRGPVGPESFIYPISATSAAIRSATFVPGEPSGKVDE